MVFFFFNDTATTEIYTLSLHDALPIFDCKNVPGGEFQRGETPTTDGPGGKGPSCYADQLPLTNGKSQLDRKSTRLNSSHANISYAVFCLKKKKKVIYK